MPGALHLTGGSHAGACMQPALLLIDMQEHFREGMAERILPQLNALVDACRRLRVPIIFTQVAACWTGGHTKGEALGSGNLPLQNSGRDGARRQALS